jgi:hypothetical protein
MAVRVLDLHLIGPAITSGQLSEPHPLPSRRLALQPVNMEAKHLGVYLTLATRLETIRIGIMHSTTAEAVTISRSDMVELLA